MADIVLTTLNARYLHAAFGLRYLLANLGELRPRAAICEFDINRRPLEIAEAILAQNPRLVGLGVYVWNATPAMELAAILKKARPDLVLILGGPEVSYECEEQRIVALADYVITGEADLKFREVCEQIFAGNRPPTKIIPAPLPDLAQVKLPYDLYTAEDIAHRLIYVEASRGCPFSCEFCLSSLDIPVRQFPLTEFLAGIQRLLDRGATKLKFVDRTFNLDVKTAQAILEFLLARYQPGHLYHFEITPDRLPEALRDMLARFPAGALQLEVGIQTFDAAAAGRIRRRQDYARAEENLAFLREKTGVHLHTDLIAGLPGEDLASFAAGFDRLLALRPQEIQVGILKRLRGTTLSRHDADWGMVYNPNPPYDILQNRLIPFADMQRLRRFARYWDMVGNSGNWVATAPLLWQGQASAFAAFLRFSDWLFTRSGRTESISLVRLAELLFEYLTKELGLAANTAAEKLIHDYHAPGRREIPGFLQPHLPPDYAPPSAQRAPASMPRQSRHAARS